MDSQAILPNIFGPTFDENQWKSFYFNNCLYFSQNQNMDFFNSFGLCNDMLTGQNLFSPYFQTDLIMRNMLFNIPPMDDTMIRMIQNINDSLAQLSNNYHDLINQNPPVLNQILNVNHRNEIIQNSLQVNFLSFYKNLK